MLVCLLHASRQLKNGVYSIIDIPRDGLGAPWFAIGPLLLSWKTLVATPKKDRAKSYKHRIALYCWLFVHLLVFLKSKKSEESTCLVGVFFRHLQVSILAGRTGTMIQDLSNLRLWHSGRPTDLLGWSNMSGWWLTYPSEKWWTSSVGMTWHSQ